MSSSAFWTDKVKMERNWLNLRLGSKQLGDDQMWSLAEFTDGLLTAEAGKKVWAIVDLSENAISSAGLKVLIDVLEKHSVQLKCLKLYKNRIADEGGIRIADLIKRQEEPLEELHLSHNQLSGISMVKLCLAIGFHSSQAYPYLGKTNYYTPCWVRLEYNAIVNPMLCLDLLRKDAQMKICLAENRDDCGPWRCCAMARTAKGVPAVHLFAIHQQSRFNRAPNPQEAESGLRDLIRKSLGGQPPSARTARVTVSPPVASSAPGSNGMAPKAWAANGSGVPAASGWGNGGPAATAWGLPKPTQSLSRAVSAPAASEPEGNEDEWECMVDEASEQVSTAAVNLETVDVSQIRFAREASDLLHCALCEGAVGPEKAVLLGPCSHVFCLGCFTDQLKSVGDKHEVCCCSCCGAQAARTATKVLDADDFQKLSQRAKTLAKKNAGENVGASVSTMPPRGGDVAARVSVPEQVAARFSTPERGTKAAPQGKKTLPGADGSGLTSASLESSGATGAKFRIHPEQLVVENDSFLCPLCKFITPHPVITTCSHIFCQECFSAHVADVKKRAGARPVPFLPCAYPGCSKQLAKADVEPLDETTGKQNGAVLILRRLRSNQMVRCRHHQDHFTKEFGQEALRCKPVVTCDYIGDLTAIEKHMSEDCPVQCHIDCNQSSISDSHNGFSAGNAQCNGAGYPVKSSSKTIRNGAALVQAEASPQERRKSRVEKPQPAQQEEKPVSVCGKNDKLFQCLFDFDPLGENQLQLRAGDHLLMYESSAAGWAAGQKVNKKTGVLLGDAGWFPAGYLAAVAS